MLKKQCRDTGQDAADQKLDAGHFYSINERRKMINNQNMTGKKNCTDDQKKFTFADCKPLSGRQTQEIKSAQRKQDCNPDKGTAFLFQENTDDRNNDNVTGGDSCDVGYSCPKCGSTEASSREPLYGCTYVTCACCGATYWDPTSTKTQN